MKEPERLIREYYATHGITGGSTLLFSYVRKSTTGGDGAIVEYYAAKYGRVRGTRRKDVVTKLVMRFNPDTYRYSMSESVVRNLSYSSLVIDHLVFDFHREIVGARDYGRVVGAPTGGNRMHACGTWRDEIMPRSEIPLNDFSGTKYAYCKYRYKEDAICTGVQTYRYWARNPYGDLPSYLRKFDLNPRAMEMFASKGLVPYMKESFLVRLRDDRPFAEWYRRHALETLGLPIRRIEARAKREIGETCYAICRKEERRLRRLAERRRNLRRMRREEREELRRRREAEEIERNVGKLREKRIRDLYEKLKSVCATYGAYEVVVPKSEREMRREGRRMHNCVGKMYPMRQGINAIVVFLHRNGKPCVDVEIDPTTFEVVQCRAVCNKPADDKANALAAEVAKRISEIYSKAA